MIALFFAGAILQGAAAVAGVDDPAIVAAVERFYATQAAEDVEGYLALWSPRAQRPTAEQLRYIFESGDDEFSDLRIIRAVRSGERVRVRVHVVRERTGRARPGGGPAPVIKGAVSAALTFEREGGEWKLIREGSAADDLAAALVDAATAEERDALIAAEPDLPGAALITALARLGGAAAASGNYPRSERIYEQIVTAARRGGLGKEEGEGLQNLANALYFQRRFDEALAAYEQRAALERGRGDDAGLAAAVAGIATIRYSLAEYGEALKGYTYALAIHERLDDPAGVAFTSLSVGNIAYLQGNFERAITAYRRSLELNRTMHHADGESRALEGLGRVAMAQGDYTAAIESFHAVLNDPRMQGSPDRLGAAAQSLGEVHFRLANLDAARVSYDRSRAYYESRNDLPNVGRVLQASALTELAAGRFPVAEDLYRRGGAVCRTAGDALCSAAAVAGLAYAQAAQEKFWDAAASYRKAVEEFTALEQVEETARSEVGLSQALCGAGDVAGGVEAAIRARRTAVVLGSDDLLWRALTAEARAVRRNGDAARALGIARAAVGVLDRLEAAALDRPGASLTAEAPAALATFAVLLAESGDPAAAFAAAERLRALQLRGRLARNERDIAPGLSGEEREEERVLAAEVTTRLAQLAREKGLPKPDPARLAALQQALDAATAARRASMDRLFEKYPALRGWRGLGPLRTAGEIAAAIPDAGELLISFVVDEDALLVVTATAPGDSQEAVSTPALAAHVVPVARRELAEHVAELQQSSVLGNTDAWRAAASRLSALLPQAVAGQLARATRVLVLPHDVLWRVPFDALPSGEGLLIDGAAIWVAASLDAHLRSQASQPSTPPLALGAVSSPAIGAARTERIRRAAPGWILRSVERAEAELEGAAAVHGTSRVRLLRGAAAAEPAVRDALGSSSALHIAAPFRINGASPLFSSILLSADEARMASPSPPAAPPPAPAPSRSLPSEDDGVLELREVMNVRAAGRIVVLSDGAATAMRDAAGATGVVHWGWMAAGVPSVLLARWTAPAPSALRLLAVFHEGVRDGLGPAVALRKARDAVRAVPETAAPVHWAGWLLLGG